MSGATMGFDLRKKVGWTNLRYVLNHKGYKIRWRDVATHTLMPLWCGIRGHDAYESNQGGSPAEWACKRCRHFIELG